MTATTTRRPWRLALAVAAASAVAVIGIGAPAAFAASVIDPDATGSITVHKHETPAGTAGDGTELTPGPTSDPVAGVDFTVRQITGVDLGTNAGWLLAQELYVGFDPLDPEADIVSPYGFGTPEVQTTTATGLAEFTGLPVGLYLVEETFTPDGVVGSAPFLVTIPITDPADDSNWIYDVHVYPKNSVVTIEKAVEDTNDYVEGDKVEWIITSEIPEPTSSTAEDITAYSVVDDLDSRLAVVAADVAVTLINPAVTLASTDYEVIVGDNPATTVVEDDNTVSVVFTAAGLDTLEANRASQVQVTIGTTVLETGIIPNDATLFTSNPYSNSKVDSNTVETCWGAVNITKVDADNNATPLAGAVFDLYSSTLTDPTLADLTLVVPSDAAKVTITTDANGEASIDLLRCSDFEDNAALSPVRTYYLVETTAPDGYELLAQPVPFTITYTDVSNYTPTSIGLDLQIENVKKFILPLTGGSGTGLLYLVGFGLVIGGVVFLVIRRRGAKSHS